MIKYFRKLDKQINDTLNIYQELGKMSQPFLKYMLFIVLFLLVISCIAILVSLFDNILSEDEPERFWKDYSIPIIIYGITCPVISTIISVIFKIFIEYQINNIKNKRKYIYKKYGKYPIINKEITNIIKYIIYSKSIFIFPLTSFFLFLPFNSTINCILIFLTNISNILIRVSYYYDNCIELNIIGVEKYYDQNESYWRYLLSVQYPNEEKRVIKKRFNDFKGLHYKLETNNTLPTSEWLYSPDNIEEASERGKKLNTYIKLMFQHKDILSNSLFYSFLQESKSQNKKNNIQEIITEKNNFVYLKSNDNTDYINNLKKMIHINLKDNIDNIFILYELNYFLSPKKRFFCINNNSFYKLRYDRFYKRFFLRMKIEFSQIKKIEKSVIKNTKYFNNKEVLIISYKNNGLLQTMLLLSSSNNDNSNINNLFNTFKNYTHTNIFFFISDSYIYDNGYGITEEVFNNYYLKNFKNTISKKCSSIYSYFT